MSDLSYLEKLPFRFGSEARSQRLREAIKNNEKPKEVNCFGTEKFKIAGKRVIIEVFNDKLNIWQRHIGIEYTDICAICGTFMLVRAIEGTTWVALCSEGCYQKFSELKKEVGC